MAEDNQASALKSKTLEVLLSNDITYGEEERKLLIEGYTIGDRLLNEYLLPVIRLKYADYLNDLQYYFEVTNKERLSGYFAFGHLCGQYTNLLFDMKRGSEDIAISGALLNAVGALFDDICDEGDESKYKFLQIVSVDSLTLSLLGTKFLSPNSDSSLIKGNALMILALLLFDESIEFHTDTDAFITQNEIYQEFRNSLIQSYESVIFSMNYGSFDSTKSLAEIERNLMLASSNLEWCIAVSSYLHKEVQSLNELQLFHDHIMNLGRIIWIIDDIVDTITDLNDRRWSYVSIRANKLGIDSPKQISQMDANAVAAEFMDKGIIGMCASDLCRSIIQFEKEMPKFIPDLNNANRISKSLRASIFAWLGVT